METPIENSEKWWQEYVDSLPDKTPDAKACAVEKQEFQYFASTDIEYEYDTDIYNIGPYDPWRSNYRFEIKGPDSYKLLAKEICNPNNTTDKLFDILENIEKFPYECSDNEQHRLKGLLQNLIAVHPNCNSDLLLQLDAANPTIIAHHPNYNPEFDDRENVLKAFVKKEDDEKNYSDFIKIVKNGKFDERSLLKVLQSEKVPFDFLVDCVQNPKCPPNIIDLAIAKVKEQKDSEDIIANLDKILNNSDLSAKQIEIIYNMLPQSGSEKLREKISLNENCPDNIQHEIVISPTARYTETLKEKRVVYFINKAHKAGLSADKEAYEELKNELFKYGESAVFTLDHDAVEWFIHNGTQENLEALNCLRGMYGLRTEVETFSHDDSDIVDIKRMQFSGNAHTMGIKWENPTTGILEQNPHYDRKHSYAFLHSDASLSEIQKHEVSRTAVKSKEMPKSLNDEITRHYDEKYSEYALALSRMSSKHQRNGKFDVEAEEDELSEYINNRRDQDIEKTKDTSWYGCLYKEELLSTQSEEPISTTDDDDIDGLIEQYYQDKYDLSKNEAYQKLKIAGIDFPEAEMVKALQDQGYRPEIVQYLNATDLQHIFVESQGIEIDEERGGRVENVQEIGSSIREQFWREVAKNEKLKEFISQDLRNKGFRGDISQIWRNCEEYGSPCFIRYRHPDNVYGISLQVHHIKALKDGGKNEMDNFMIVLDTRISRTKQYFDYDGELCEREYGGCRLAINSHKPLHEYDNPLVYIYQGADGKLVPSDKSRNDLQRMKVLTYPSAQCGNGEHVLYYGGPDAKSCCVGKLNGNVRGAEYNITKINSVQQTIHKAVSEYRR